MEIIDNLPYELTEEEVINELKIKNLSERIKKIVVEVLDKVKNVARPKAVYKECFIDEKVGDRILIEGIEFKSHVLSVNLKDVGRVFPYIVTAGCEIDDLNIDTSDIFASYVLDLIKELVLRKSREGFEEILFKSFNIEKASYMSPGSLNDWPISEQKKLFELLGNVEKTIGVKLLETYVMTPIKTVSGIYFPTEFDFKSCMLCPRENCPSRKAPFNSEMYETYMQKKV